ncbi:VWA domain-containing protein [Bacillus sp. Marseille-Q1617]|uniref:vWA domain-containing protein n=1 Tax=Bacillus sp. Marseille-Q1617 TaxID=2736887 RepID=UPI00158CB189|nr:VWA domain-containing protein [Bacillus sp. Marseille-Q1617]
MYLKRILPVVLGVSIFIIGCGNEENEKADTASQKVEQTNDESTKDNNEEKNTEKNKEEVKLDVKPLPSSYEELEEMPVGEESKHIPLLTQEDKEKAVERFKGLPDVKNNPSEEELDYYYQELLSMVQRDFKGPEEMMKQLKFQSFGNPEIEDSRYQFKENLNVEIILDASGSMAQNAGNNTKMESAKEEILNFVKELPEGTKVGMRVYGHKGSNADSDKELSCKSSEIVYPINTYETAKFQTALDQVKPTGWTPISLALKEAQKDLSKFNGENNTNIVYLVSDGIETCDQDPVEAAKDLYDSNLNPIINVIGFDVDGEGQRQLKEIADTTEGIYSNVEDQAGLKAELKKINNVAEAWDKWKEKGEESIELKEVQNSLDIFEYITKEDVKATDERVQINLLLSTFTEFDYMSKESRDYLQNKNNEYHKWISGEIDEFKNQLKVLNEKNYQEAKKALEEKYQLNSQ